MTERFFKILTHEGVPPYTNSLCWLNVRPTKDGPGKWLEYHGRIRWCKNGFHLARQFAVGEFLYAYGVASQSVRGSLWVYEAEVDMNMSAFMHKSPDKICVKRVRLLHRVCTVSQSILLRASGRCRPIDSLQIYFGRMLRNFDPKKRRAGSS